jgi:hypothetical protein
MIFTLKNCYDDYKTQEVDPLYSFFMSIEITSFLIFFFNSLGYVNLITFGIPIFLFVIVYFIKYYNWKWWEKKLWNADIHLYLRYWIMVFNFMVISFFHDINVSVLYWFIWITITMLLQYYISHITKKKFLKWEKYPWFLPILFGSFLRLIIINYLVYGNLLQVH